MVVPDVAAGAAVAAALDGIGGEGPDAEDGAGPVATVIQGKM